MRLLAREAGGSMRDAERMLETAIATSSGKVTEAEVASSLGVASRTTVLKLADAILQKNARRALAHVRELAAAAPTSNRSGATCSKRSEISRSRNFRPVTRRVRSTIFRIMK